MATISPSRYVPYGFARSNGFLSKREEGQPLVHSVVTSIHEFVRVTLY